MRAFVLCLSWLLSDSSGTGGNKSSWSDCQNCWGCYFSHDSMQLETESIQLQKPALPTSAC